MKKINIFLFITIGFIIGFSVSLFISKYSYKGYAKVIRSNLISDQNKLCSSYREEDYFNNLGNELTEVSIEDSNLYENILKSDIVITVDSTSSLEAIILDKPVIGRKNKFVPFKQMGIGLEYENIDELEELVDKALYDKKIIEELKIARDMFRPKKFAADNIKDIIQRILENEL